MYVNGDIPWGRGDTHALRDFLRSPVGQRFMMNMDQMLLDNVEKGYSTDFIQGTRAFYEGVINMAEMDSSDRYNRSDDDSLVTIPFDDEDDGHSGALASGY